MKKLSSLSLCGLGLLLSNLLTAQITTQTLNYTGAVQEFTVPSCVSSISFTCYGAQGANGVNTSSGAVGGTGGFGSLVSGIYTVTPNSVLNVYVGGAALGSLAGYNGGGSGAPGNSGGGGGASDIRIGGIALANRVLVAGGGGGGGNAGCVSATITGGNGGAGGGGNGTNGVNSIGGWGGSGGVGTIGGSRGIGCSFASGTVGINGTSGQGGSGGNGPAICGARVSGGGGGGGFFGGGGGGGGSAGTTSCTLNDQGAGGGGAGGTNYFAAAFTNTASSNGVRPGNGLVIFSYSVDPTPAITVNSGSICSGNSFTILPSGAGTYTISGGSSVVSPTSDITYTVTGTSSTGCPSTLSAVSSVTVRAAPVITTNSGTICSGSSFTILPSGANTYTFTGGSATVSPSTTTSYSVTGTNGFGCVSPVAGVSSVTVLTTPTVAVNNGTICAGSVFTMNPSGASTYTFANGSTILSPASNTVINVTGTSTNGCISAPAVANITVYALPVIGVNSGTICAGRVFTMNPSGASTYTFANGSSTIAPASNTVVNVTGTSSNGCVSAAPAVANVTVYALPVISVNSSTICAGGVFTINPSGASTYTFANGSGTLAPASNTAINVTGTSSNGCVSAAPAVANITVFTLPVVTVNSGTICAGTIFTMSPSGASTYTFANGSATLAPGSNTAINVTGTGTNGCVSAAPAVANITVFALPVITVNSGTICAGNIFTMNPSGASTYTFANGSSTIAPASNTVVNVTGTTSNGCISAAPAVAGITVIALPVISVNSGSICAGNSFSIVPSGAASYTIQGGSDNVSPSVSSTYSVTGSSLGCVSLPVVSSVTVYSLPSLSIAITPTNAIICDTETIQAVASGASSYTWNATVFGAAFSAAPSTSSSYTVSGTDNNGCINIAILPFTVNPLPALALSASNTIVCTGGSSTLTALGAQTYSWSTSQSTNTIVVTPVATSVYSITGTNISGCSKTETIGVSVNTIVIAAGTNTSVCDGTSANISASGAMSYTWMPGNFTTSLVTVSPSVTTTYTYNAQDVNQCFHMGMISVTVNPNPDVSVNVSNTVICNGETATVTASGASSYSWTAPSGTTGAVLVVNPSNTSTYVVTGTDVNGCHSSGLVVLAVDNCTGLNKAGMNVSSLSIYPNPGNGEFILDMANGLNKMIEVRDLSGRILSTIQSGSDKTNIDLQYLANGVYYLRIQSGNSAELIKVIKQ